MKILTLPDNFLRNTVATVTVFDDELKDFSQKLVEMMIKYDGVGLAATQVGEDRRVIAINVDKEEDNPRDWPMPMVLVNPEVTKMSAMTVLMDEACLSVPGKIGSVMRSREVEVTCQDERGEHLKLKADGWMARVLQHEIDHLNGVLFIDRISDKSLLKDYDTKKINK
ncbi:peptide deformylase [Patescibacteria group bacterium]|nr:peptide deformylase [Patescibacteria group bacterium]